MVEMMEQIRDDSGNICFPTWDLWTPQIISALRVFQGFEKVRRAQDELEDLLGGDLVAELRNLRIE